MPPLPVAVGVVLAYLIGSVPFGVIVARARGVDIFKAGSGNIGATNVGRVLGRKFGILVFALDFLKGAAPTAVMARTFGTTAGVAAGLAALLGHLFPIFLRFRGGKGVATGFGVVAVLMPGPTAAAALTWVTVLAVTRYVSLASVLAAVALAVVRVALTPDPFGPDECILTGFSLLAAALVAVKHRSNFARLARGQENRLADSPRLRMLARVLHLLAVGLWFGAGVFFSFVAAPSLFATFEAFAAGKPDWLTAPGGLTEETGRRLAGVAVGPMFPPYFALQGACAFVALVTALGWQKQNPGVRVHRWRVVVLLGAALAVLAGWPLVGKVSELRAARYAADAATADAAKAAFAAWHTVSLLLNLAAIALAGVALALAAALPERRPTDEHDSQ
jgi:acyl phosphate:glycerol-3-phosphate acyltransferase